MKLWKYNGRMAKLTEIAAENGLTPGQLYGRIKRGYSLDDALFLGKKLPNGTHERAPRHMLDDHDGSVCTVSEYAARHGSSYRKVWFLFQNQLNAVVESLFQADMLACDITPRVVVRRYAEMVTRQIPLAPTPRVARYTFDSRDQLVWQMNYARETGVTPVSARERLGLRVTAELQQIVSELPTEMHNARDIAAYCARSNNAY